MENTSSSTFEYPLELRDYWQMLVRRKFHMVIPFALVMAGAAALAFLLPPTYRSEATFIIERQNIPQNLIRTTVDVYVQEQIQQIRQLLVTHDNLINLAEQFDLYPQELASDSRSAVQRIRENIEVEMVDVTASDPDQQGQRVATIAFTVAYTAETPELARDVANELAKRYTEVHRRAREMRAAGVTEFLDDEAKRLSDEIADLEKQLAGFKQEELRQLPELMSMNLSLYERTEQQIQMTEERIRGLEDRISETQAELSLTEPYAEVRSEDGNVIMTGAQRLSALTAEYLRLSAVYSAQHPDVVKLSREIRVLAEQTGSAARADELMSELVRLQDELRTAERQYSPEHPEVQRLEKSIAAVQRGFQSALIAPEGQNALVAPPDNPRYVALKTQLDNYNTNLSAERERLTELNTKLEEYENRLFQTPVVERDFKTLSRDYDNALSKYRELREKQLQAELAQTLEAGENAERFVLANPAYLPSSPESPNRLGILLLGGLFGLAVGVGVVALGEYTDKTVRSAYVLTRAMGIPPIAVIPRMGS